MIACASSGGAARETAYLAACAALVHCGAAQAARYGIIVGMDRNKLQRELARTEKHIAETDKLIADQRVQMLWLHTRGYNTASAKGTLGLFQELQELEVADRERLRWLLQDLGK